MRHAEPHERVCSPFARVEAQRSLEMLDREIGLPRPQPEPPAPLPTTSETRIEFQAAVEHERGSCWLGCALYDNGCYAETGALALHWNRVSSGMRGGSWSEFCAKVAALRPGRLWRYAQAGDLPGYGPKIDGAFLDELVAASTGSNVIAFTHKPALGDDTVAVENRRLIAAAVTTGPRLTTTSRRSSAVSVRKMRWARECTQPRAPDLMRRNMYERVNS
jgi:hypothetical protein